MVAYFTLMNSNLAGESCMQVAYKEWCEEMCLGCVLLVGRVCGAVGSPLWVSLNLQPQTLGEGVWAG